MKSATPVFALIMLLADTTRIESHANSGSDKQDEVVSVEKRVLLHSETDLLSVIANLSNQVTELSNNQANHSAVVNGLISKLSKQEAEIVALKNDNMKLQSGRGSGSTYIRWGKKSCPQVNSTNLVYSGYAAGSLYTDTGAASNYLCLSPDPLWNHYTDAVDSFARVYGMEYEFSRATKSDVLRHTKFFGKRLDDQDAPCSVCETQRSNVLMIPGRNACYRGWTLEYSGYLVAGYYGQTGASEYVCMDKDPEFNVGGSRNDNGALLYFVEAICGSLECPPYVNGRELTCAVCSK